MRISGTMHKRVKQPQRLLLICLCISMCLSATSLMIQFHPELFTLVERTYGAAAKTRVTQWQALLEAGQTQDANQQLTLVNNFFNEFAFISDQNHWDTLDYWATPIEFIGTNAGDCEDYSIAKYVSLRALGVREEQLRLVYVKALALNQAHMVLAYYASAQAVPLILDNLTSDILPATKRTDLRFIYSFNGEGLWNAKAQGRGRKIQPGGNNRLWAELHRKIELQTPISIGE